MLSTPEKILFILALVVTAYLGWRAAVRINRIIQRGEGNIDWATAPSRLMIVGARILAFAPVFTSRAITSVLHGLVGWGFLFYLLVNTGDLLRAFIPGFLFMGSGTMGNIYRLIADVLSVATIAGMAALMFRRFALRPTALGTRRSTPLHPNARAGISRDSAIVGAFILLHVGFRFMGESLHIASSGADRWQPFASATAAIWAGLTPISLEIARHATWWLALGLILAFIPYFELSKHIHLFFAPLNFLLRPERDSIGQLGPLDFEDESIENFGAARLEDLSWYSIMNAYACIMCNRCQDACPAYQTGKVLSPSALEINKRYYINSEAHRLAAGEASGQTMLEVAIPSEAVWACTACGACIEICPVGNEPMQDILNVRRYLVLMENQFPEQLQAAYRGMKRTGNPWNIPQESRLDWADGLEVPRVSENPDFDLLWWVGCSPSTDPRAQKIARSFAQVLQSAGVNFAVLGREEYCTGDAARRSGNEYLFNELAMRNVETLNRYKAKRIVTTCPHCLHTIKNEYPAFGGQYEVIHHTQLLRELFASHRLAPARELAPLNVAFHDPCYLGRMNGVYDAPRSLLKSVGITISEMPRRRARSFCCGAGGGQMWKEEEQGEGRVSSTRLGEARETGAEMLAVACPFCTIMLSDAAGADGDGLKINDVVEFVAERLA